MFKDFHVYCGWCGSKFNYLSTSSYTVSGFKLKLCGKECYDKAELGYARYILGKEVREEYVQS